MGKWARLLVVASGGSWKNKRMVGGASLRGTAHGHVQCFSTRGSWGGQSRRGGEAVRLATRGLYGCDAHDEDEMGVSSGGVAEALSVMCRGNHDGVGWAPLYLEVGRLRSPGQLLANMPAYGLFAWFVPRLRAPIGRLSVVPICCSRASRLRALYSTLLAQPSYFKDISRPGFLQENTRQRRPFRQIQSENAAARPFCRHTRRRCNASHELLSNARHVPRAQRPLLTCIHPAPSPPAQMPDACHCANSS